MRYFDFDQINPITKFFHSTSYQEQLYSIDRWFNFSALVEKQDRVEDYLLLIPLSVLLYAWYTMFKWYDQT